LSYIQLSYSDLVLPALLVVMNGALSLALHLKLERQLGIAAARMLLQLVLVGYVLTFLFAAVSPLWTALAAFIMVVFASREIVVRQKRRFHCPEWCYDEFNRKERCAQIAATLTS
jgi:putative ABC transport system permease protein